MPTIKLPTPLRRFTGQTKTFDTAAATVGEALEALASQFPDIRGALYTDTGDVKSFIRVFLGDQDIEGLQGLQTPLAADAVVSIFPPIAGA